MIVQLKNSHSDWLGSELISKSVESEKILGHLRELVEMRSLIFFKVAMLVEWKFRDAEHLYHFVGNSFQHKGKESWKMKATSKDII